MTTPEPMTQFLRTEIDPVALPVTHQLQQNLIESAHDPFQYAEALAFAIMMLESRISGLSPKPA